MSKKTVWSFFSILLMVSLLFSCQQKKEKDVKEAEPIDKEYQAGPILLQYHIDKKEITLAETLHLLLDVKINKEYEVEFPGFEEQLTDFQLRDFQYHDPKLVDKENIKVSMEYFLDPYLSGEYQVPPLKVFFWTTEEGSDNKHQIETGPVTIKVTSLLEEDYQDLMIKDIQGPLTPKGIGWIILLSIMIALLLIAAAVFVIMMYLRKKQKKEAMIYISAYQLAMDRLDALVQKNLIENEQIKEFYYSINTILRKYIEDRFQIRAPEQTTEEFLENLKKKKQVFKQKEESVLKEFLNQCDIVKYAKHEPAKEEIQQVFNLCKQFIVETRDDSVLIPENSKDSAR